MQQGKCRRPNDNTFFDWVARWRAWRHPRGPCALFTSTSGRPCRRGSPQRRPPTWPDALVFFAAVVVELVSDLRPDLRNARFGSLLFAGAVDDGGAVPVMRTRFAVPNHVQGDVFQSQAQLSSLMTSWSLSQNGYVFHHGLRSQPEARAFTAATFRPPRSLLTNCYRQGFAFDVRYDWQSDG